MIKHSILTTPRYLLYLLVLQDLHARLADVIGFVDKRAKASFIGSFTSTSEISEMISESIGGKKAKARLTNVDDELLAAAMLNM